MDFVHKSRDEVISWLEGRLRGDDGWNSRHLAGYLHTDLLRHILSAFQQLEQQIRVKILLAMLEISAPGIEREKQQFLSLLSAARQDEDEWVSRVATIVEHLLFQPLPPSELSSLLDGAESIARKLRCRDLCRNCPPLPPELSFLNYSVLNALSLTPECYGAHATAGSGHFRLKQKLRTSVIKDEILTKAKDHKQDEEAHSYSPHPLSSTPKSGDIFMPPNTRDKQQNTGYRPNAKPIPSLYTLKGYGTQPRSSTTKLLPVQDLPIVVPGPLVGKRKRKEHPPSAGPSPATTPVTPSNAKLTPENDKVKRKRGSLTRSSPPPPASAERHSSTDSPSPVPPPHKPSHKRLQKIHEKKRKFMEDMFSEADLLSEKQKQIIIDFMVGQATKPYNESGDKLTFTLNKTIHEDDSEKTEVETLFEMDYSTKQWRKLKKSVVLKIPT